MPKLKSNMQSLIQRSKAFLTPSSSSQNLTVNGFTTVKAESALFPKPDPRVDGEDCLHDCSTCTVHYPAKFSIDEDDKLYGHVNGWDSHLIVGTGKTDWVRDVTDEKGSVMEAVGKYGQEYQRSENKGKAKMMLSASNMPTGGQHGDCDMEEGSNCLLLPSWQFIEKVLPEEIPDLMKEIVEKSVTNKTLLKEPEIKSAANGTSKPPLLHNGEPTAYTNGTTHDPSTEPESSDTGTSTPDPDTSDDAQLTLTQTPSHPPPTSKFLTRSKPIPHSALILMCSHKTRDARCGQSAPLLRKELERHLRPLGLYRDLHDERPGGVGIYFINHVGGHKYSANVMIYRRQGSKFSLRPNSAGGVQQQQQQQSPFSSSEGQQPMHGEAVQGIWLARVRPEDCENIVKFTVLQGKVVKPERQLRGGFDRERGLVSW